MAKKIVLTDNSGNKCYPVTRDECVKCGDRTLPEKFSELEGLTRNTQNYENDINQRIAFNKCVKSLYILEKPLENEVFVITYFSRPSSTFLLGITAYNLNTLEERVIAANNVAYEGNKVIPIYKDGTKVEVVGYIYISIEDYTIPVQNSGQGTKRMPYINDTCFNLNDQGLVLRNYINEDINDSFVDFQNFIESYNLIQSKKINPSDITKLNYANSALKAIYLKNKPADGFRVVLTYLSKFQETKYQLGLTLFNESDGGSSVVSDVTGITYNFDELVEIYNNSTDKKVVGYAFVSSADYIGAIANQGEGNNRLPYLGDLCFDINKQPLISNSLFNSKLETLEEEIKNIPLSDNDRNILVWGDSITWGSAASSNDKCYTAILRQLIVDNGYSDNVINCGVGGETFQNILVRQGALGFYLADDIIIPKSPDEKIEIQRTTSYINNKKFKNTWFGDESYFSLLLQGELGRDNQEEQYRTVNPIWVNGVECTMTLEGTQDNNVIYLSTNKLLDEDVTVKSGMFLYPHGCTFKAATSVFSIGTNGGFQVKKEGDIIDVDASIQQYIQLIDLAIEKSNSSQFIVCSPYGGGALRDLGVEGLKKLEVALTKRYGNRHFNWRKYLIEYGLSDAGIEATSEDFEAISKGEVPPSLLSDGLHPNDYGHKVIGTRLYYMIRDLYYLIFK